MPEESSSEVTSSSAALVMSPANSLVSSDIGDVDLEFWDLDVNGQNQARLGIIQNGFTTVQGHTVLGSHNPPKSEAGSLSGTKNTPHIMCYESFWSGAAIYCFKHGNNRPKVLPTNLL